MCQRGTREQDSSIPEVHAIQWKRLAHNMIFWIRWNKYSRHKQFGYSDEGIFTSKRRIRKVLLENTSFHLTLNTKGKEKLFQAQDANGRNDRVADGVDTWGRCGCMTQRWGKGQETVCVIVSPGPGQCLAWGRCWISICWVTKTNKWGASLNAQS